MHTQPDRPGDYLAYWGKARPAEGAAGFHRLAYHALDVAAVGQALLQRDPSLRARLVQASGLLPESVDALLVLALALHDLGKFAPGFQDLKPELVASLQGPRPRSGYPVRHDTMGLTLWSGLVAAELAKSEGLRGEGPAGLLDAQDLTCLVEPWMRAVLGHHGQPVEDRGELELYFPRRGRARTDALAFAHALIDLLGPVTLRFAPGTDARDVERALNPSSWMVAGIAVLCDWVGSNDAWFPYRDAATSLREAWALSQAQAPLALEKSGILPVQRRGFSGITTLFPDVDDLRPMQRAVEEVALGDGPQLFVLEDLTGSGKTEAAVTLAHRLMARGRGDGIFFALPTMATANAMYARIEKVVPRLFAEGETPSTVLAHSAPQLLKLRDLQLPVHACEGSYDENESSVSLQCAAWISDSRKRALLAQVGIGTVDQALLSVLQVRHSTLRLLGVGRNVLVVDEVHAYDSYMSRLLTRLLEFHAALGGSAILLSATLPTAQRRALAAAFLRGLGKAQDVAPGMDYPLLSRVDASGIENVPVKSSPTAARDIAVQTVGSAEAAADAVVAAVHAGERVCWIRNTVDDAIEAHALLAQRLAPGALTLFHARFAMGDRLRIEQQVLATFGKDRSGRERLGHALVATQVVEQSLDLDFDQLITDLAPMDLIIQRAGRLHRHARPGRGRPLLRVFAPDFTERPAGNWFKSVFPRASHVYPHWGQVWLTLRELVQRGALQLPGQARSLMDAVFSEEARAQVPPELERASSEAETKRKVDTSVADGALVDLRGGYGGSGRAWEADARAPTRLGEPTSLVRLCRLVGDKPVAYFESPALAWEQSQVQVARRKLARSAPADAALVALAEAEQPFHDDGTVTVILREDGDGWVGRGLNHGGATVRIRYDQTLGLRVEREA